MSLILPRSAVRPSYATGFADTAAKSVYSNLWNNLVAAWVPSLGITGNIIHDVVKHLHGTNTGATWLESANGPCLTFSHSDNDRVVCKPTLYHTKSFTVSVKCRCTNLDAEYLFSEFYTSIGLYKGIYLQNSGDGKDELELYIDGTVRITGTNFWTTYFNQWVDITLVFDNTKGWYVYRNGTLVGSYLNITPSAFLSTTSFAIGNHYSSSKGWTGNIASCYVWNRALSLREIKTLTVTPLAPFRLKSPIVFLLMSPLSGTISGSSEVEGDLTVPVSVAGSHTTLSIFGIPTANFRTSLGGETPVNIRALQGVIEGTSSLSSPALTRLVDSSSTIHLNSDLFGDIAPQSYVYGTTSIVSSTTASLTNIKPLSGTIVGAGDVDGDVLSYVKNSGIIVGESTLSGTIKKTVSCSGSIDGDSSLSGTIKKVLNLLGEVVGSSTLEGDLNKEVFDIFGVLDGEGVFSGTIKGIVSLDGNVGGSSTLSGILDKSTVYSGSINGEGELSGSLSVYQAVDGSIVGTSDLVGEIYTSNNDIRGIIDEVSVLDGSLHNITTLYGDIVGDSELSGSLTIRNTSGTISGTGVFTANLNVGAPTTPDVSHILPTKVVYIYTSRDDTVYVTPKRI